MNTENQDEPFVKTGKVELGITPSEVSGKPSTLIKNGAAIQAGEAKQPKTEKDLKVPIVFC